MRARWADREGSLAVFDRHVSRVDPASPPDEHLLEALLALGAVIDALVDLAEVRRRIDDLRGDLANLDEPTEVVRALLRAGLGGRTRFSWRGASVAHTVLDGAGLPLTLGLVTVVAAPADAGLRLVGMPFHVVIGCSEADTFIDPVEPALCDSVALSDMVGRYSSGRIAFDRSMLTTMTAGEVLVRVFNNLENAANVGRDTPLLGLVRVARRSLTVTSSAQGSPRPSLHLLN